MKYTGVHHSVGKRSSLVNKGVGYGTMNHISQYGCVRLWLANPACFYPVRNDVCNDGMEAPALCIRQMDIVIRLRVRRHAALGDSITDTIEAIAHASGLHDIACA